jgi:hypothetical protein
VNWISRKQPAPGDDDYVVEIPAGLSATAELLQALYERLKLPVYFGFNWNALLDCLRDFHWLKQSRSVIMHLDLPAIPRDDLRIYLEVLADAVASWRADEDHLLVVSFPASAQDEIERLTTDR